jgi:outer membrane protein insertion porin family
MIRSMKAHCRERRFSLARITPSAEPVPGRPGHVLAVFEVVEDHRVYVSRVIFRGRRELSEEEKKRLTPEQRRRLLTEKKLLRAIKSRPGGFLRPAAKYDPDTVGLDEVRLQGLYRNNGYSDARVRALRPVIAPPAGRRRRRLATVTFDIREGRLYTYGPVTFKGLESVSEEQARLTVFRALGVKPRRRGIAWGLVPKFLRAREDMPTGQAPPEGMPYSEDAVLKARRWLRDLLGTTGRPFARVGFRRVRTAKPGVVGLEFSVAEGPQATVGEVRIRGNARTRDRIIRREMFLLPGDIYDSRKLNDSKSAIRSRGLFAKVESHNVPGDEPDSVDIELDVEETQTGHLSIGGYVSPEDGSVGGTVALKERNFDWRRMPTSWDDLIRGGAFRGGAQSMNMNLSISESIKRYALNYSNPWIWDSPPRYSFGTGLFHFDKEFHEYEDRRTGFNLRLGRRLFDNRRLRAYTKFTYQRVHIEGMDRDLPDDILEDEGTTILNSMTFGLVYDGRNNILMPTKGVLLEASEEIFGGFLDGDEDLRKTSVQGHFFIPAISTYGYPHVIRVFSRADWVNPYDLSERIPVFERLFAGGIGTVRGYDYRTISPRIEGEEVGGSFRFVQNFEYIFPVYKDVLRGVVFFDAGSVWAEEGDFEWHDQRRSVGLGLHVKTPMGPAPIKFYFSKAINPKDGDDTQTFQMSFSLLF